MPFDTCPLCGTSVAFLRAREHRNEIQVLRDRVVVLRRRSDELSDGKITPRTLKDEVLWLCPDCRRLIAHLAHLDRHELQRRIDEHVRRLEQTIAALARRAG